MGAGRGRIAYEARLISPDDQKSERYRAMQPFGQVPAYEEDDLVLFESGAILLHIADRSEVLMPSDSKARARVTAWMFAALNSIEPHIQNLTAIDLFHAEANWAKKRRPGLSLAQTRLASDWLDSRDYLEDRFTVATFCSGHANADARSITGCVVKHAPRSRKRWLPRWRTLAIRRRQHNGAAESARRDWLLAAIVVETALGLAAEPARFNVLHQKRAWPVF